jgi:F-type H+-transporting ATPase subunit delta
MSSILKILNAHPLEHFIWTIIDLEKTNYICRIFECFEKKVYGILEQPLVNIESAFVLTKTEVTQIVKKIESIINKKIHYKLSVNKDLIGGIRVVSEKFSYDNTIQTKLKLIKEELFE